MPLCSACVNITTDALRQNSGYKHISARSLPTSAKSCGLCSVIFRALLQNTSRTVEYFVEKMDKMFGSALEPVPITLHGFPEVEEGQCSTPPLSSVNVDVPILFGGEFTNDRVKLNIFALPGSAARECNDISGRPPLTDPASDEAFSLLKHWLNTCRETHEGCKETFSEIGGTSLPATSDPKLPTRVIDVGSPDGSQEPHLFITGGAIGKYATLSHCWGTSQFLTTTTESLREHIKCIPLKNLTKTFQDAITITRKLGLRYIWIDSLCIIQNDQEDWRRESASMGLVYQHSEITIAASAATDGSVGCFVPRPKPSDPIELPYLLPRTKSSTGSMFITLYPDEEVASPELMPLNDRAWVTQEWLLSRRMVHYTASRIQWTCKTLVESEEGEIIPEGDQQRLFRKFTTTDTFPSQPGDGYLTDFPFDWCELVFSYSARKLTYNTDKLIALQGLAEEIKKRTHSRYHAGIWDCETLMQLFWTATDTLSRPEALRIFPTWSWASTMGAVTYHGPAREGDPIVKDLVIGDTVLHATGHIKQIPRLNAKRVNPRKPSPELGQIQLFVSTSAILAGITSPGIFYAYGDADCSERLGWVSFDEGAVPAAGAVYAVPFSKNTIDGEDDGYNVLFLQESAGPSSPSDGGFRRFCRVGVGEVVRAGWFDDVPMEQIEIA